MSEATKKDLPLYINFYKEKTYIILTLHKRLLINDENRTNWINILNQVAEGKEVKISCQLICRDKLIAKTSLKQVGLLK